MRQKLDHPLAPITLDEEDEFTEIGTEDTVSYETLDACLMRMSDGEEVWFPRTALRMDDRGRIYAADWKLRKENLL